MKNPVSPLRILLADDDDDDIFLFREALGHIQLETELTIAENGMELLRALQTAQHKPDIIFLDMNMPVKNGLECLEDIRGREGYETLPVVILSTSTAQYLWECAYQGGANLYIQKPTSFTGLVEILKKCLLERSILTTPATVEQFLITN